MFDKLNIGIVGVVDYTTRLYNRGNGFNGMEGTISFGATDSVYLGFTSERAYVVKAEGDLVVSTETSDECRKVEGVDGVYGFDVDWSDAAKARGCGIGTLFVTNPDAPQDVSVFTVRMDAAQSVRLKFASNTGANARAELTAVTDVGKLDRQMRQFLDGGKPVVDSSEVRRALRTHPVEARGEFELSPAVRSYIVERGLYRGGDNDDADPAQLRRNILT